MQSGNSSGEAEPITSINITPLVDVSLVLVIIFMVTMPFLAEKGLRVKNSADAVVKVSSMNEPILVEITTSNISVEGHAVAPEQLAGTLAQIMKQRSNLKVAVSASRDVSHGRVVMVLDKVTESGAAELNLLQPQEMPHGRS